MEKSPFELLVEQALLETAAREWAPALNGIEFAPSPAYSLRHQAWEKKFLKNPFGYAKKRARPVWQRALRYAACVILALSVSLGGLVTFNPAARAWVEQIVAQWFGSHARFSFSGNAGQETGAWRTGWLPEGFELVREATALKMTMLTYKDSSNTELLLFYTPGSRSSFGLDSEHQAYEEVSVHGGSAYLLRSTALDEPNYLIWTDESSGTAFRLASTITSEELIKMAESIAPQ